MSKAPQWCNSQSCLVFTTESQYQDFRMFGCQSEDSTEDSKRDGCFFQAAVTSILLYGCTTWTLTKRLEKKLDGNYTRMLRAILNKSWQQHPTRHQLYGHLPSITKTIQVRRTRHAGHCWRSRDELIRDVLLWIPTHGRAKAGRPARTYIQQLCEDTGCCPEDLPRAMNDREKWRERVRDIRATSTIWWWWWMVITKVLNFGSLSDRLDRKRSPWFVADIQAIIDKDPSNSIRPIVRYIDVAEFLIRLLVHEDNFYSRPWRTRRKTTLQSLGINLIIPSN